MTAGLFLAFVGAGFVLLALIELAITGRGRPTVDDRSIEERIRDSWADRLTGIRR